MPVTEGIRVMDRKPAVYAHSCVISTTPASATMFQWLPLS